MNTDHNRLTLLLPNGDNYVLARATGRAIHKLAKSVRDFQGPDDELEVHCPQNKDFREVSIEDFRCSKRLNELVDWVEMHTQPSKVYTDSELEAFHDLLDKLRAMSPSRPIFIDIDGVAGDFDLHYVRSFGAHYLLDTPHAMWHNIDTHEHYYRKQTLYPLFADFYDAIKHLNVKFLSSCRIQRFADDKTHWITEMVCRESILTAVMPNEAGVFDKNQFFLPGAVLIDDYDHNIDQWDSLGGAGISHSCFMDTAQRLYLILTTENENVE